MYTLIDWAELRLVRVLIVLAKTDSTNRFWLVWKRKVSDNLPGKFLWTYVNLCKIYYLGGPFALPVYSNYLPYTL